jgi:DNA polymerase V
VPKHAHGTANLDRQTSSSSLITKAVMGIYDRIVNPDLLIRRLNLTTNHVVDERTVKKKGMPIQLDLFTDYEEVERKKKEEQAALDKERRMQEARLAIKRRYGKNAILKGLNFDEGATARERNAQIGGHKE